MSYVSAQRQARRLRRPERDVPPSVEITGDLLQVRCGRAWAPPPPGQPRGRIVTFTPAARLRLAKQLHTIDYRRARSPVFITLTYPDERAVRDKDERANDLYRMHRYIEEHLGREVYGVWRCEWERRKTGAYIGGVCPHLHMVLWPIPYIHWSHIVRWWQSTLSYRGKVVTEIKRPRDKLGTLKYLTKYIKKPGEATLVYASYPNTIDGRHYGWFRCSIIPRHTTRRIDQPSPAVLDYLLRRHYEALPQSDTRPGESFSIMGQAAQRAGRIAEQMAIDWDGEVE